MPDLREEAGHLYFAPLISTFRSEKATPKADSRHGLWVMIFEFGDSVAPCGAI